MDSSYPILFKYNPPPALIFFTFFGLTKSLWTDAKVSGSGNVVSIPQACAWQRPSTHGMD